MFTARVPVATLPHGKMLTRAGILKAIKENAPPLTGSVAPLGLSMDAAYRLSGTRPTALLCALWFDVTSTAPTR